MPNPEDGPERGQQADPTDSPADDYIYELKFNSPQGRLAMAGATLLATITLALSIHGDTETLAQQCEGANPSETPGLTFEDYFDVSQDPENGQYYPTYDQRNVIEKLLQKQVDFYLISPERNNHIANQVADYATVMVGRANLDHDGYTFYRPGDPGEGYFQGDPHKPVPDDFQGYGWLWHSVKDENGDIVKQEVIDGIYRFSDGNYATNPWPGTLSVYDRHSQAVFTAPRDLGLDECALIPGNGATQGWRVQYYDFWPEGELAPPGDIQGETFDYDHSNYYYPGEMDTVKEIESRAIAKLQTEANQ